MSAAPRLIVVPGLNDSPPAHWQSELQLRFPQAQRVVQHDWVTPDLDRWAARVASVLARGSGPCVAVAHSFGVLALLRHLRLDAASPVVAALLVAPADPDKFGLAELLPQQRLALPHTLVLSSSDPWMRLSVGQRWAGRWGSAVVQMGDAGHINIASGHGRWAWAEHWVSQALQRQGDLEAAPAQASVTDLPARTLASPVLSRAACA